jgi:hypothetical protein
VDPTKWVQALLDDIRAGWGKWGARGRSLSVLLPLFLISIVVYAVGKGSGSPPTSAKAGTTWPDTWMPTIIVTCGGLIALVVILDTFSAQDERRREMPVRGMAGGYLKTALEGIVAFAMTHPIDKARLHGRGEAVQFVRDSNVANFWLVAETEDADAARDDWRTTLEGTHNRLDAFLDECKNYLHKDEIAPVLSLRDHAQRLADNPNPWSWPLESNTDPRPLVRDQVRDTWCAIVDPFCNVLHVYKELAGDELTGRYQRFQGVLSSTT